jgi:hypothetical protein
MIALQMDFGGMKIVDDGRMLSLEDRALVECLNVAGDAQRVGAFERADEVLRQVFADHALTELPVDALCPLTPRTLNVFDNYNIATVADLVQRRLSEVRDWYNFGKESRAYLGERLRTFGLNLADQHDHKWTSPPVKRRPRRLDRLLVLPTFQLDQGYNQDHVLLALSSIADVTAPGLWGSTRTFSSAPGSQYGLNVICNRTDLGPMTVRRLFKDLVAKGLVDESTQGTFTLAPSGLRLVQAERQAAEQANADARRRVRLKLAALGYYEAQQRGLETEEP